MMKSESFASQSMEKSESMNYWTSEEQNEGTQDSHSRYSGHLPARTGGIQRKACMWVKRKTTMSFTKSAKRTKTKSICWKLSWRNSPAKKFTFKFFEKVTVEKGNAKGHQKKTGRANKRRPRGLGISIRLSMKYIKRKSTCPLVRRA